jgi:glycosyltransferase involved in cell wall biosynthesis
LFPGWINGPRIHVLATLAQAGLLPYPSDPDFQLSIPNKAIEYLALGLPIITSLRGPVSDLIASGACGRTFEETSPADLARLIVELYNNPCELGSLSANAAKTFEAQFNADVVYGQYADFIEKAAIRGHAAVNRS